MSGLLWAKRPRKFCILCCLNLASVSGITRAEQPVCIDQSEFVESGWQHQPVKDAMDHYLRDHRIRINWQQEPRPPSAIGRDYYEWLWQADIGAAMKSELVARFCD